MNRFYLLMIASLIFILSSCGNIWYSAKTGNIEGIEKSLDQGISIESKSQAGNTPLIIAAYSRNVETVEYLCKRGANVNAQGANGATALIHAAYYDFYDVAEILVKYHADKNIKDIYGHTALYYASQFEHPRINDTYTNDITRKAKVLKISPFVNRSNYSKLHQILRYRLAISSNLIRC